MTTETVKANEPNSADLSPDEELAAQLSQTLDHFTANISETGFRQPTDELVAMMEFQSVGAPQSGMTWTHARINRAAALERATNWLVDTQHLADLLRGAQPELPPPELGKFGK